MKKSWHYCLIVLLSAALVSQILMQRQLAACARQVPIKTTPTVTPTPHEHHSMMKEKAADDNASPFAKGLNESMSLMHQEMMKVRLTGNNDRDFLATMIPHHQGAIDMAKLVLLYGKDERARRLAQGIIVEQQSEIEAMKIRLDEIDSQMGNKKEKQ